MSKIQKTQTVELTEEEYEQVAGGDLHHIRCCKALAKYLPEAARRSEVVSVAANRADKNQVRLYTGKEEIPTDHRFFFVEYTPGSRTFTLLGYTNPVKLHLYVRESPQRDEEGQMYYSIDTSQLDPVQYFKPEGRCIPEEAAGFCIAPPRRREEKRA